MGEQLTPEETGEIKKKTPVTLVYRENDMYQKWGEKISEMVRHFGHPLEAKIFSRETSEDEIKSWFRDNFSQLKDRIVLGDNTSLLTASTMGWNMRAGCEQVYLDESMREAIMVTMIGENSKELDEDASNFYTKIVMDKEPGAKRKYLEYLNQVFDKIFDCLSEDFKKQMEIVIIKGKDGMLDNHEPFFNLENPDEHTEEFAKTISQWLTNNGVGNVKIVDDVDQLSDETTAKLKNKKAFVIFNRHHFLARDRTRIAEVAGLQMPIETFVTDAIKKLPLDVDETEIKRNIKEALRKQLELEKQ